MDEGARPTPKDMKLWVDVVRFIKRGASGGAFGFFTYAELSTFCPLQPLPRPPPFYLIHGTLAEPESLFL